MSDLAVVSSVAVVDEPSAWRNHAAALAGWTMQRLVHRTDQWQAFRARRKQTPACDCSEGEGALTLKLIARHYAATDASALIAVAAAAADLTARWLGIEVDCAEHADQESPPNVTPGSNFHAMLAWHDKLKVLQLEPILEDTDGAGGYRLLVFFDESEALAKVVSFGQQLTIDYGDLGLHQPPTVMKPWLRLPGLHPQREHRSRIWDGSQWRSGEEAVRRLLAVPSTPPQFMRSPRPPVKRRVVLPVKPQASPPASELGEAVLPASTLTTIAAEKNTMVAQAQASKPESTAIASSAGVADVVNAVAQRTGLREEEIVKRLFAWFADQDEVVQASVLGQIPAAIRPDVVRLVLERMARAAPAAPAHTAA
jgi:hypothetical protein